MRIDDGALEQLSGLFLQGDDELLASLAFERGLVPSKRIEAPVGESLVRHHGVTAEQLSDLKREAERRRADRIVDDLKAGRPVTFPESSRFGKYHLVRELGRGGLGRVWLAWEPDLRRFVALKIVGPQGEVEAQRMRREAQIAAQLDHPNIAKIYEAGQERGLSYIAMQYVEGRSLEGLTLPARDAARIIRDAARLVHLAHERHFIHRDLKPGNIMQEGDDVFVIDFGLAKSLLADDSISQPGVIVGTLPYISPEQALGRDLDRRADIYGLGATLYRLTTGHPPVEGENAVVLIGKIVKRERPEPRKLDATIDPRLEAIVLKAMDDVDWRYATAEDLADDLDRFLSNQPVSARPAGALRKLGHVARRFRAAALLIALALLAWGVRSWWVSLEVTRLIDSIDAEIRAGQWEAASREIDQAVFLAGDSEELRARRDKVAAAERDRIDSAGRQLALARSTLEQARLNLYKKGATFSRSFFSDLDRAESGARQSLAQRETTEAHYLLARILNLQGRHEDALAEYDRALAREKTHVPSRLGKARTYIDMAVDALFSDRESEMSWCLESARSVFDEMPGLARRVKEGETESELAWAWHLLAQGDAEGAIRYAGERAAQDEEFHVVSGVALTRLERYRDAMAELTAAIDARPNYYQAFFYRGTILKRAGNGDYALREFDQAIAIHPRYGRALVARGDLRYERQDFSGAAEDWSLAIRAEPDLERSLRAKILEARSR